MQSAVNLKLTCKMVIVGAVAEIQEIGHEPCTRNQIPYFANLHVCVLRIFLWRKQPFLQDIVVHTRQTIDGVVINLSLLAKLDCQLQLLYTLLVTCHIRRQDHRIDPVKLLILSGKLAQAGEAAVAVDNQAVIENDGRHFLPVKANVVTRLLQRCRVALANELRHRIVVGRTPLRRRVHFAPVALIRAHPCSDAVVLRIEIKLIEANLIHLVILRDAINGELAYTPRLSNISAFNSFC